MICNRGKCVDQGQQSFLDECIDCTLSDQIEHELLRDNMGDIR